MRYDNVAVQSTTVCAWMGIKMAVKTHMWYQQYKMPKDQNEAGGEDDDDPDGTGDGGGRGDIGRPIILECLFPRSDCVTVTFNPREDATFEALLILTLACTGVSGGVNST